MSIEDDQARLLAYSATHGGAADELRMLSILGREGPVEHLRQLRELGVYDRLRRDRAVIEVPADEGRGWRRRLVMSIKPLGSPDSSKMGRHPRADHSLGTIWIQEGFQPLDPDSESVLQGAAAIAARLIHRTRSAPTQEALQIQRLLGIRGGGVDIPSLASALALPTSEASAVVGIAVVNGDQLAPLMAEIAAALRLLAGGYVRESLVTATDERLYVLIPRRRSTGLAPWVGSILDRLTSRFGTQLRAAIAAPVVSLDQVPAARTEVDRVLDRPMGTERVTSLTQSRTPGTSRRDRRSRPVPCRSSATLGRRALADSTRSAAPTLVDPSSATWSASAMSGPPPTTCTSTRTRCATGSAGQKRSSA